MTGLDMKMDKLLTFETKSIKNNAKRIVDYLNDNQQLFGSYDDTFWGGRTLYLHNIKDQYIVDTIKQYKLELLETFYNFYGREKTIYTDSLHIVRWPNGYELKPHADAENPDGSEHSFPWRDFGTVSFLNDDFVGGELHLPNQNITIPAKAGVSVIFPGTLEYLHGVKPVTSGIRYTIASFLTYNKEKEFQC